MFIRSRMKDLDILGNESYNLVRGRANLYEDVFPFRSASVGLPYSVAFVVIHGSAPTVSSLTDVWGQNIIRTLPTSGFTLAVSSDSAADINTSGTGAWKVEVDILDVDYVPFTLTLNLNGQTKVQDSAHVGRVLRVNDFRVVAVGSGAANAGNVYAYDDSSSVTLGVPQTSTKIFHKILTGDVVGRGGFYTVPKGCKIQTQQVRAGITDASSTNRFGSIQLKTCTPMGGQMVPRVFPITGQISSGNGLVVVEPDFPLVFSEKTDLVMQAQCSGSSVMAVYMDAVLFYA